jgi:hypothetical protein
MNARRTWIPVAGLALVTVVVLLIAGAGGLHTRAFALGSPNQTQVATLNPAQQVCEGPVTSPEPVGAARIWAYTNGGPSTLAVLVEDATTHKVFSSGRFSISTNPSAYTTRLAGTTPSRTPVSICLTASGSHQVVLLGSAPVRPGVLISQAGKPVQREFSLVLLKASSESLISALPTAFSRAALFRPSWVGSWTFWLLTVALLASFGLAVVAVRAAAGADEVDVGEVEERMPT